MLDHAKHAGSAFFSLVEILPNAAEWTAKRWGDIEARLDGNEYAGGVIAAKQLRRFVQSVDILGGGNISTTDAVNFEVNNILLNPGVDDKRLHELLLEENIEDREVGIYLAAKVPNGVRNGGFEYRTGNDFDNWTEDGGVFGWVVANTVVEKYGTVCCDLIAVGSPNPASITADNYMTLERGQALQVDFWARGENAGGGDQINLYLIRNDGRFFDWTTRAWVLPSTSTAVVLSVGQTWTWISLSVGADELGMTDFIRSRGFKISIEADAGDRVQVDGVQMLPYLTVDPIGHGSPFIGGALEYGPEPLDLSPSDVLKVYVGEVVDWEWTKEKITVRTRSISARRFKEIPVTIINAQTVTADIPAEVEGKPFPMTYGALEGEEGTLAATFSKALVLAHGRLVNFDPAVSAVRAYFDRPGMKLRRIGRVHGYISDSGYYAPEMLDDRATPDFVQFEWTKDADNATIYETSGNGYLVGGRLALTFYQKGRSVYSGGSWVNPANAIDNGLLTSATWGAVGIATAWWYPHIIQLNDAELIGAYALVSSALTEVGTSLVNFLVTRSVSGKPDRWYNQAILIQNVSSFVKNIPWDVKNNLETRYPVIQDNITQKLSFWMGAEYRFGCSCQHSSSSSAENLYEIGTRIDFATDLIAADIAGDIEGREYQDTWGGRKTAGNLIDNPADVIESVYRDELGLAAALINTTSHDAFYTERTGVQLAAGQVFEVQDVVKVLAEMAFCFHGLVFEDLDGLLSVVRIERDVATSTLEVLDREDFKLNTLKVKRTARESVVTDFVFHYGRRPSVDEYFKNCYVNRTGQDVGVPALQTRCAAVYAELGNVEQRKEYYIPWVVDDSSLYALAEALVYWNCARRYVLKGTLGFEFLGLELGDQRSLRMPGLMPAADYEDAQVVLVKKRIRKHEREIDVEFLEIHGP